MLPCVQAYLDNYDGWFPGFLIVETTLLAPDASNIVMSVFWIFNADEEEPLLKKLVEAIPRPWRRNRRVVTHAATAGPRTLEDGTVKTTYVFTPSQKEAEESLFQLGIVALIRECFNAELPVGLQSARYITGDTPILYRNLLDMTRGVLNHMLDFAVHSAIHVLHALGCFNPESAVDIQVCGSMHLTEAAVDMFEDKVSKTTSDADPVFALSEVQLSRPFDYNTVTTADLAIQLIKTVRTAVEQGKIVCIVIIISKRNSFFRYILRKRPLIITWHWL